MSSRPGTAQFGAETRSAQVSASLFYNDGVVIPEAASDLWMPDRRSADFHYRQARAALDCLRNMKEHLGISGDALYFANRYAYLPWSRQCQLLRYHRARAAQHRALAWEIETAFGR